jgi:hypothetical protein
MDDDLREVVTSCMRDQVTVMRGPNGSNIPKVEYRVVRVEVRGVARLACWLFVILFGIALVGLLVRVAPYF